MEDPEGGGDIPLFGQIFPKNCMKMKEIGLRGWHIPSSPLNLPLKTISVCARKRGWAVKREGALFTTFTVHLYPV